MDHLNIKKAHFVGQHTGALIMADLDYPFEYAEAVLEFLENPKSYVGTTGHELDPAMREYLIPVTDDLRFKDPNKYPRRKQK